jgi:hypothetical protein
VSRYIILLFNSKIKMETERNMLILLFLGLFCSCIQSTFGKIYYKFKKILLTVIEKNQDIHPLSVLLLWILLLYLL